ncbi:BRE4-like protein [Mya arenaria]|uniref:BRE4-like protein n=1 Tax=Mya arenaria TaxID=6604 RepID=A0ABY7EBB7_MYAAR|nr:BRE4-like protein [Mya arenaria]
MSLSCDIRVVWDGKPCGRVLNMLVIGRLQISFEAALQPAPSPALKDESQVPVLKRQKVAYRVFVVEQFGNSTFNKGRLMNIGFTEARKYDEFDCFIFHDVDLIPEDDRNMATCSEKPRHMSPAVDVLSYTLVVYK